MVGLPDAATLFRLALVLATVLAFVVVYVLDRPTGRWGSSLRSRFLFGVPWGTLVSVALVLAVYLFVQGGLRHWYTPVTIPFRAWSYFYPLGMLTAGFAHSGAGHLVGNLVGTLVLAPIAEHAWGHYPRERGVQTFTAPLRNPYVRAFVVVPGTVVLVTVLTSALAIGPVIGFSAAVFAFAGYALVNYPLTTVVAVTVANAVRTFYAAFQQPTLSASAGPSYASPWWADIAIQGHALGLLVGVLLGVWVSRATATDRPSAARVAAGIALFGVAQSLWAVYWFRGGQTYVLYRAAGLALVIVLAALVAGTVAASARPLSTVPDRPDSVLAVPRWQIGATALLFCTAAIAGPAVPVNLTTAQSGDLPGQSAPVTVQGYEVVYAEDVTDGMVSVIDVEAFGETTRVNTSGVIVRNRERGIWMTAVSKGRLDFTGATRVNLGGIGWRDSVGVTRTGWNAIGGGTVYRVRFRHAGENTTAYTSSPVQSDAVIAGRNVSVEATPERFRLNVTAGNRSAVTPMPAVNETVSAGGLEFVNVEGRIYALDGATRVRVAKRETYE
jgi:membrane associated rhomboid family serine protease